MCVYLGGGDFFFSFCFLFSDFFVSKSLSKAISSDLLDPLQARAT